MCEKEVCGDATGRTFEMMERERAGDILEQMYPRMRLLLPQGVRGVVMAGSAADGMLDGDIDVIVISVELISQRMLMQLDGGITCDAFIENEVSIERAIVYGFKDHIVRMLGRGAVVADEPSGAVAALQRCAREALEKPRPASPAATLRAISEACELLRKLERHRSEPVIAQLLYNELLVALLRARVHAEHRWGVPTQLLLEENRHLDPAFAAWVAVSSRRLFNSEMLPMIRERVQGVLRRFPTKRDIATQRAPTPRQYVYAGLR